MQIELNEQDRNNLLFCLLYSKEYLINPKSPALSDRIELLKFIDNMIENIKTDISTVLKGI